MKNRYEEAAQRRPVEALFLLQADDPDEQLSVEDLSEEAGDRLVEAIERAGFRVVDWRTREA